MSRAYWNVVSADYDSEILSVFDHDSEGLVRARILAAAAPGRHAADVGCGVGKFTPLLADVFATVQACDRSARALALAQARCDPRKNVDFSCFDLASEPAPFTPVDLVLCVNVLIMPSLDERLRAWRAVTNQVAHGGTLVLVVPALESVQFGYFLTLEERLLAGHSCAESLRHTRMTDGCVADMQQGVHALEGVRTKHYLHEELAHMLPAHECDVLEIAKLKYGSGVASSWDWLVTARRRES